MLCYGQEDETLFSSRKGNEQSKQKAFDKHRQAHEEAARVLDIYYVLLEKEYERVGKELGIKFDYELTKSHQRTMLQCHSNIMRIKDKRMANNDTKDRLDLLSLLTEELSAGETVVDVSDKTKLRYTLYLRKLTDREDKQQLSRSQKKV